MIEKYDTTFTWGPSISTRVHGSSLASSSPRRLRRTIWDSRNSCWSLRFGRPLAHEPIHPQA
jgi:hypothetical protein